MSGQRTGARPDDLDHFAPHECLVSRPVIWALVALLGIAAAAVSWMWGEGGDIATDASLPLAGLLGEPAPGFAQAGAFWDFRFPRDHGAHLEFRSEVWSLNGQLQDGQGRDYGFQLTFIRLAMVPEPPQRSSVWATNEIYRAHFALTDGSSNRFRAFERFSREALGLAGTSADPHRVWLEDWSLEVAGDGRFRLQVATGEVDMELDLTGVKPILTQDEGDVLDGAPGGTGGFHFFVIPRLATEGSLRMAGTELAVTGSASMDRIWGELPMARGQLALNRFALQLDDGRDLLCFELRRRAGGGTPIPSCLLIAADGSTRRYGRRDIRLEPVGRWSSPIDGTSYPVHWLMSIPDQGLELAISPVVDDQELDFALRAWSGAVAAKGSHRGKSVTARGHLELSGYAPPAQSL